MRAGRGLPLTAFGESLEAELSDRLEHAEPAARPAAEEAPLDERLERVEVCLGDLLGGFDCQAPREYRESAKEFLLRRR